MTPQVGMMVQFRIEMNQYRAFMITHVYQMGEVDGIMFLNGWADAKIKPEGVELGPSAVWKRAVKKGDLIGQWRFIPAEPAFTPEELKAEVMKENEQKVKEEAAKAQPEAGPVQRGPGRPRKEAGPL